MSAAAADVPPEAAENRRRRFGDSEVLQRQARAGHRRHRLPGQAADREAVQGLRGDLRLRAREA